MKRRLFLAGPPVAVAVGGVPRRVSAQASGKRLVGVLTAYADTDPEGTAHLAGFQNSLDRLGWTDGRNVRIEYRRAVGNAERAALQAAELLELKPDVVLTTGGTALVSVLRLTRSVPVVFVTDSDPVALGLVWSLARPGGNATGFVSFSADIGSKWLQLLKEISPGLARVAILKSSNPQATVTLPVIEGAAPGLGLRSVAIDIGSGTDIERSVGEATGEPNTGLLVLAGATALRHRDLIVGLAARHRLPAMYSNAAFPRAGGLMSYGVDRRERMVQAAGYVDRILGGEKPANLPVQTPTVFELVLNVRTARTLDLALPPHLLALASELIE